MSIHPSSLRPRARLDHRRPTVVARVLGRLESWRVSSVRDPLPNGPRRQRRRGPPLDWADRPFRELLRLAWPICVGTLSYSTMTLVDTLFVAQFGAPALAGVGLGGTAAFVLLAFSFGLLRGTKTLVAQARGAGNAAREERAVATGIVTGTVLGVLSLVLGVGVAFLLPLVAESALAGDTACHYLIVRSFAAPPALIFVAIREARYARGDSRSPMTAGIIANVLNIVLDAVFVWGFDWGVLGVAWATVIATVLQALLLVVSETRRGIPVRRIRRSDVRDLVDTGAPTGVQFLLETGSFSLLTILLAGLPSVELAAHQVAIQVIHFGFLPALAVSESVSVLTGQAVGANRLRLVHTVSRWGLVVAGAYAGFASIVFAVFGSFIAHGFSDDAMLIERTRALLLMAALFNVFDAAGVIARGALRGTGDVRVPAVVGIVCAWVITPPLTWWLGIHLGMGALGGWIGLASEIALQSVIVWWRLCAHGWVPLARVARRRAKLVDENE